MKLRIILGVVIIFFCSLANGQVSKTSFYKAVDLLKCKTVQFTLTGDTASKYQQQCPCNSIEKEKVEFFLKSIGNPQNTLLLVREIEALKNVYKEKFTKQESLELLSEEVFKNKERYQKISVFVEKHKKEPTFSYYRNALKAELRAMLEEPEVPNADSTVKIITLNDSSEQRVSALENEFRLAYKSRWLGKLSDYFILFALLMSIAALVLSIIKLIIGKPVAVIDKSKSEWGNHNTSVYTNSAKMYDSLEVKDIKNKIAHLEAVVKNIETRLNSVNSSPDIWQQKNLQVYQEIQQPESRTAIFFLSSPGSDGNFDESSASLTYKEGATIYRFTKTDNSKARFQIDEREASTKLALQYPDKRINPVCEAENAFNPHATRIITVKAGEAELHGNKWILNKKARIRYEN